MTFGCLGSFANYKCKMFLMPLQSLLLASSIRKEAEEERWMISKQVTKLFNKRLNTHIFSKNKTDTTKILMFQCQGLAV